jgi:prepilin-type processing-associated H-X9-DG protein
MATYPNRAAFLTPRAASRSVRCRGGGFSVLELLVVIGIISMLAALLFPAFLTVRGKARQVVCASNLHQIGLSVSMYVQDNDGLYPRAVDAVDRAAPQGWAAFPDFAADIPRMGMLHEVLQPYIQSPQLFACPADTGFGVHDFYPVTMNAFPSSYEKYGTSYIYRTGIAARRAGDASITAPSQINVLLDSAGYWHGTLLPLAQRYNVLFADGHVRNVSRAGIDEASATPLSEGSPNPGLPFIQ